MPKEVKPELTGLHEHAEGPGAWKDIIAQGWGPSFAAGSCLTIVRALNSPSIMSREVKIATARWYYHALIEMVSKRWDGAYYQLEGLKKLLTIEQLNLLAIKQ